MKRSEYNAIIQAITEHERAYEITGVPKDPDGYFSWSGCAVCDQGGATVYDTPCLETLKSEPVDEPICGSCLSIIHNADVSGLDGSVTEEDVEGTINE